VPRLTKSDIETALLSGAAVPWTDSGGKSSTIQLSTSEQRRLFEYLGKSKLRDVKALTQAFIDGLATAYVAAGDPAAAHVQQTVNPSASGPWKIHALKITGFGGVNIWNGKPFQLAVEGESLLIEGPNGSGKSSFNAAIIWALTGERPRDQGDSLLDEAKPVFDATGNAAGSWPPVAASDTSDKDGEMAKLGKRLNDKAAELMKTVSGDLSSKLTLADPKVQQQIIVALDGAERDLTEGLSSLPAWKLVTAIARTLPNESRAVARSAAKAAKSALIIAIENFQKQQADAKFRLKAAGAHWHNENVEGSIENCPLCNSPIVNTALREELEGLRSAGEAATRSLQDNINAIMVALEAVIPQNLRHHLNDTLTCTPRADLERDYRKKFIEAERYTAFLTTFSVLAEGAITGMPSEDLADATPTLAPLPAAEMLADRLNKIERMCRLAEWHEAQETPWSVWWATQVPADDPGNKSLSSHLRHLSKSLGEAEPYRIGADALRLAWTQGKAAAAIEIEQQNRQDIANRLAPLKQLGNLAEAQARDAITELSGRISAIHSATYIVDRLKFQAASLDKKAGLTVRGQLGKNIRIDATLIANTSWLRGILWAFIHALREEAVEQIGGDIFPVVMLDDPQQTFDNEHRARWAEQFAKLQKTAPGVQILLTTHDDQFLSQIGLLGITGRKALICSAGEEFGHITILEGDRLDRNWAAANQDKTPAAAKDYIADVREFVEGILKIMLRGVDPSIPTAVMGDCREMISGLHDHGIEPWSRPAFKSLVAALAKSRKEIKWMEEAHHSGNVLTMTEASDVERHWRKTLRPTLDRCFRMIRDHRALHGGLAALHAFPPSVALPEGHKEKVRQFRLPLLGTAAALTDGRVADGCLDISFDAEKSLPLELKDHFIFRLSKQTLEPVGRPGDLLLVRDHADATPLSLVIAMHESQLLARRLQVAGNHSDVAVLTASAINPRLTASPIVAKLSTLTLKKIVGVLYNTGKVVGGHLSESEVVECGGEAAITTILSRSIGLVEVRGHSAEPLALDKQFLIIANPVSVGDAEKTLDGRPVIAEDSDQSRFFKRLRVEPDNIILESLEIGGDYPPILLAKTPSPLKYLTKVWPVLGVLFEKP